MLNVSGGETKDYIVEANGNGAAFFDFDNDEDMDILIVNGSTLEHVKDGGDLMVALYRNDGTFSEVTPMCGVKQSLNVAVAFGIAAHQVSRALLGLSARRPVTE